MVLNSKDRIIRARVQMMKRFSFFGYLAMYLNINPFSEKVTEQLKKSGMPLTMAVDRYANLMYSDDFVQKLTDDELIGVLAHEVMHVAQFHLTRVGNRNPDTWNIATDLVINRLLELNKLTLPKGKITSQSLQPYNIQIPNPENFSAEEIYDKIYKKLPKMYMDVHIYSVKGLDGKGKYSGDGDEKDKNIKQQYDENEWKNRLVEAAEISKERGDTPRGMDRYIDELIEPKINWKHLLLKYITRELPFDYTWMRPSKKYASTGIYLPSTLREGLSIVTSIDTSGSMSSSDLTEALSEIMSITRAYPYLNLTVIICDADIHRVYEVTPYNTEEIMKIVLQGGGGTSHIPVYNWLEKNKPQTRILINLTDGYTEFPKSDYGFNTIWVLTSNGCEEKNIPFGKVLKIHKNGN